MGRLSYGLQGIRLRCVGEVPNFVLPGLRKGQLFSGLGMEDKTPHFSLRFSVLRDEPSPLIQMS